MAHSTACSMLCTYSTVESIDSKSRVLKSSPNYWVVHSTGYVRNSMYVVQYTGTEAAGVRTRKSFCCCRRQTGRTTEQGGGIHMLVSAFGCVSDPPFSSSKLTLLWSFLFCGAFDLAGYTTAADCCSSFQESLCFL